MTWQEAPQPPPGPWKLCPHCSAQAQTTSAICPHCGASYLRQPPPSQRAVAFPKNVPPWIRSLALGTVCVLGLLWYTGDLDPWMSNVGLNKEPCIKNYLTGVVVCGDEARDYCHRLESGQFKFHVDACDSL